MALAALRHSFIHTMKHTSLVILRSLIILSVSIIVSACTSAEVRQSSGSSLRGFRIAAVSVAPGASLRADDLAFLRENQVKDTLTAAIRNRLSDTGKLQPAGATLTVNISSVRVRSTASAVMLGIMAGPDHLEANIAVVAKGQTVKTFIGEASRTSGAFAGPGAGGRIESLCEELAISIVGQL